jgi:phenylpropionate dioxygenase-like ring-hydroxylating dioxygenase large terminal subunit
MTTTATTATEPVGSLAAARGTDEGVAVSPQHLLRELRSFWHPVATARQVSDRPLGVQLLDEPIVLFRTEGDRIVALKDLCLHRGTALSLGWVDQGQIVCQYHGWTYDAEGRCTRIPSLPPERGIPRRARAISYLAEERFGLIWVCLEHDPKLPPPDLPQFGMSGWRATLCGPWEVYAHATRVLENFLDVAHPAWVHPGLLDDGLGGLVQPYKCEIKDGAVVSEYQLNEPFPEWKAKAYGVDPSELHDGYTRVHYTSTVVRPFTVVGYKRAPGGDQIIFFNVCPRSEQTSIAYLYMMRTVQLDQPDEPFREFQELLWSQDKRVLESQRPFITPLDLREEMHVSPPDVVNVAYRRYLAEIAQGIAQPGAGSVTDFGRDVLEAG